MCKKIIALALTLACSQAFAQWTTTPFVSGGDGTYYWDANAITYQGDNLKIWTADDFGEAQHSQFKPGEKYSSVKEELELNCAKSQSRVIEYIEYSERLTKGMVVVQNKNQAQWTAIEPNTLSYHVMKAFCKKPHTSQ
jgi:hypothetical protein